MAGKRIELTAREYHLLDYLLRNEGQVCSKEELCDSVWGSVASEGTEIVDKYVERLTRKVGLHTIVLVPGGYRLGSPARLVG